MAGLTTAPGGVAVPRERDQIAALLEMRWRIFRRNMRRDDAKVSFVLYVVGRVLVFTFGIGIGAGFGISAYFGYSQPGAMLAGLFATMLIGWQGFSLLRGTVPNGVEVELHRFPLRLRTYIALWMSAGALEGLTIVGAWACLGTFIGLAVAGAGLLVSAFVVALFFLLNLLLSRVVFLWLGRLLAKRRTRELVLIVCSLLGLLPRLLQTMRAQVVAMLHRLPIPPQVYLALHWFPPHLAAQTILGRPGAPLKLFALVLWTAAPAVALTFALRRAFRGEQPQEFAAGSTPKHMARRRVRTDAANTTGSPLLVIAQMEWARLRHSGMAMYQMLAPLLLVAIFGLRMSATKYGGWVLPVAAAYIGLSLRCGNVFGSDGAGAQLWLLIPLPLRTALLGKNLFAALLYGAQVLAAVFLVRAMSHRVDVASVLFTVCWVCCYVPLCFSVGNLRSLRSPRRVADAVVSARNRSAQQGAGGGWQLLLVIAGCAVTGLLIVLLAFYLHRPMLAPAFMLPFSIGAVYVYWRSLSNPAFNGNTLAAEPLVSGLSRSAA